MLEIDVDVRRLLALLADEAFEQEIDLHRIDGGDAEHIADGGIRRRAAPLAENVLAPGKAHDVMDRQEIRRDFHLGDKRQFLFQCRTHLVRDDATIT